MSTIPFDPPHPLGSEQDSFRRVGADRTTESRPSAKRASSRPEAADPAAGRGPSRPADRADGYIPLTHSRHLAAAAPPGTLRRYTEFDLFGHVMPNRQLDPPASGRELLKLFRHAWLVGQEFL